MTMSVEPRFLNRELSWLAFNERVLEEASLAETPLLERLKFLAITASNLDEFFMVRVGGLQILAAESPRRRDPSGRTPRQQLDAISQRVQAFSARRRRCFRELESGLCAAGIRRLTPADLSPAQRRHTELFFEEEIFPTVTPLTVEGHSKLPPLMNRMLCLAVLLAPAAGSRTAQRVLIPLGTLPRIVRLPSENSFDFILLEDAVRLFAGRFFIGRTIRECGVFRITRNADLSVREDLAYDLLAGMEEVLSARRHGDCVRLETQGCSTALTALLARALHVDNAHTYVSDDEPLALGDFMALTSLPGREDLRRAEWTPQPVPGLTPKEPLFDAIRRSDLLLCHPYESFDPVIRFINEAADDPEVIAIKQILYRTSSKSPVVAALCRAARNGKYVTVIVELKARFDEARNIGWAKELENAGVQVIYGIRNLKTHAKLCMVVRREHGFIRRYLHFGTGNYNEITARLYTDISFLTSAEEYGRDASAFFNAITGYSDPPVYRKISAAPSGLRAKLLELIENESRRGRDGRIQAKFNSLADPEIIEALYRASQAGVRVDLNVRGICCLRPGVPGLSERIRVVSIVGHLLEHSRIFCFRNGGNELVFISSADWMPRNLDRRIELLIPVDGVTEKRRLIHCLKTCLNDTVKGRVCGPDGRYVPAESKKPLHSQKALWTEACERAREARRRAHTVFQPYRAEETP
jgi:polyphosphate kinase